MRALARIGRGRRARTPGLQLCDQFHTGNFSVKTEKPRLGTARSRTAVSENKCTYEYFQLFIYCHLAIPIVASQQSVSSGHGSSRGWAPGRRVTRPGRYTRAVLPACNQWAMQGAGMCLVLCCVKRRWVVDGEAMRLWSPLPQSGRYPCLVCTALCWLLASLFRSCVAVTAAGALPPLLDAIPFVLCVAV